MVVYRVKDWALHFENSESRKLKFPRWVAVPNKHDGKSYRRVTQHERAVELFCAWNLIIQVASKMPVRGTLADSDGPLTAQDLADMTGFPSTIFALAFNVLCEPRIGWLESTDKIEFPGNLPEHPEILPVEGKGREVQGREEIPPLPPKGGSVVGDDDPKGTDALQRGADKALGFDQFWREYPAYGTRKKAKGKCLRIWDRKGLWKIAEKVICALQRCKASDDWKRSGGKYIPMPTTWLNDAPWETDPAEQAVPSLEKDGEAPGGFDELRTQPRAKLSRDLELFLLGKEGK